MHIVIFEVKPFHHKQDTYFDLAAELKAELERQPGFVSVERFKSLAEDGKFLSVSVWESEEAIINWKKNSQHQHAQQQGHEHIFDQYRIRVAHIYRDYDFTSDSE